MDGDTITCLLRVLGGNSYGDMPIHWWFGFCRSYEEGRTGEEGRICHVLSEFDFGGAAPSNWYSDSLLSGWKGVTLVSGNVVFDCANILQMIRLEFLPYRFITFQSKLCQIQFAI